MNLDQLFKIALDQPAKAEKAFLWFLQSLIVLWILSVFFGWPVEYYFNGSEKLASENRIEAISVINLAAFLIVFALTWIFLWLIFVDSLVQLLFYLLNRIVRIIRVVIVLVIMTVFYLFKLLLSYLKLSRKPKKFWKRNKVEEESYLNRMSKLRNKLGVFTFLNEFTDSVIGYEALLKVISYERRDFIKSRVIRYYSILLIVVLVKMDIFEFAQLSILKTTIIMLTVFIGFVVFELNYIYSSLETDDVHFLKPQLEFEIYKEFIFDSLSQSILAEDYLVSRKRRFIDLSLKQPEDTILHKNYFKEIIFVPIDDFVNNINKFEQMKKSNHDSLLVFVSNHLMDIDQRNKIFELKFCYIHATDAEQLQNAVLKLLPVFKGSIKL